MTTNCDGNFEQVRDVVFEHLDLNSSSNEITHDTPWSSLTTNSLDCVELIMAFEEKFDVIIADDVFEKVLTVGEMTTMICRSLT